MSDNTPNRSMAAALEALPEFVRGHRLALLGSESDSGDYDQEPELIPAHDPDAFADAQVMTSWTGDREAPPVTTPTDWTALAEQPETFHRPVLDLDFPAVVIPSTTPGHGHLYLDKVLTWTQYAKLLDALVDAGIIEPGYRDASVAREFTSVRLPWVKKPDPGSRPAEVLPEPVAPAPEISVRSTWLDGRGF